MAAARRNPTPGPQRGGAACFFVAVAKTPLTHYSETVGDTDENG